MRLPRGTSAWAIAAAAAAPALRRMLRRRVASGREIAARLPERFGVDPVARPAGRVIWLHAASVGETVSALPVLPLLPEDVTVLFTTGTVTSARLLAARLEGKAWAGRVLHRFVPLDVPRWVAAFLEHWRPDAACFVESEFWPNILAACRARRIPLGLINARLSARSAARWRFAGGVFRDMIGGFAWIAAQTTADAARLQNFGAPAAALIGDLKLAADPLPVDAAEILRVSALVAGRPVWVAASTHPGEEAIVETVHRALLPRFPELLTIVVPRHPARGEAVAALLGGAPRRSLGGDPPSGGFWVGDTLGELGLFYHVGKVIFLGKSFAKGGGQNPWEPARLGCAIAAGPATANFAEAVATLRAAGGMTIVDDVEELIRWVGAMLDDPASCTAQGERARHAASASADLPMQIAAMMAGLLT